MIGPARRLAPLLPVVACLLAPAPALAQSDTPPAVAGGDVEGSAAMAQGLATAPRSGVEGLSLLLSMAVQGHAESQYLLGLMHLEGAGVVEDRAEAVKWLERATAQSHAGAGTSLARMAARGDARAHLALGLIARERAEAGAAALSHLRAAADAEEPEGLLALAELYRAGGAVERDDAYAAILFRAAAAAAMAAVGEARQDAADGILGPGSEAWLAVAAARTLAAHAVPPADDPLGAEQFARYWVGLMLLAGAGTPADVPRGLAHHRAAADCGFALAEFSLGLLYERGHGLPRDLAEARRWFARAADHGLPLATSAPSGRS